MIYGLVKECKIGDLLEKEVVSLKNLRREYIVKVNKSRALACLACIEIISIK